MALTDGMSAADLSWVLPDGFHQERQRPAHSGAGRQCIV
jgi:hypothetical protein